MLECNALQIYDAFVTQSTSNFSKRHLNLRPDANALTVCLTDLDSPTSEQSDAPRSSR
jgi:hypothetical protein